MSTFSPNNSVSSAHTDAANCSYWAGFGPEEADAPDCHYPDTDTVWPTAEEASRTTISNGPAPIVSRRLVVLERDGEAIRDLAKSLALSYGEQWEQLGFERVVYWLHRTMIFVDGSSCSSSN